MADLPLAFWIGLAVGGVTLLTGYGLWRFLRALPFLDRGDD